MITLVVEPVMMVLVMTISTETKAMTPSGARRMMTLFMAALVMTNSLVIPMKAIVRTMMVSLCPAWGIMTLSIETW